MLVNINIEKQPISVWKNNGPNNKSAADNSQIYQKIEQRDL